MDCSSLLAKYYNPNDTTSEIWLDLDETTILEYSYNDSSFLYGIYMIIGISIITSYILSCHCYPYLDKQQKLIKLEILGIEPNQQDKIAPYLHPNTQYNKDVENIIFDYANIDNVSVNSILDSTIELRSPCCLCKDLCLLILAISLLTVPYTELYSVISHWTDSYRSYVETQCYSYDDDDFQVNIGKLCPDYEEFQDYIFVVDDTLYQHKCYVHKERFTVRATTSDTVCCASCCVRCGNKGCGYCCCFCCVHLSCSSWIACVFTKINVDICEGYKIEQKAMNASSNKDEEYLLTIQESSGEI